MREKQHHFTIEGIANIAKVRKELFDGLNNRKKVSSNLLTDDSVREVTLEGRTLLVIDIPRASRKHRPVHLTTNPFGGNTYRRLNDGDRHLPDEDVRRMIAEQVEDSRDDRILRGYDFKDLCTESFRAYRQVFANREPEHPWNTLEDLPFLRQIGGWRKDRESSESGITLAGLLMFGWMSTIQEELPNYMLDYQERPEAKIEERWIDRLTLDGKWSGNLYDFYRKVYLKLTADLKVPFALEKGERKEETPVHVALREALANVIVHADYSDRASVLVVKRPDMFGFRNPGVMRIPPEVAIRGGEHDCRNRTLHKMFRLIGVGEQAGSGIPKIYGGWASQHWRAPALYERIEPYNQTLLELRMVDLLPKPLIASLRKVFGASFDALGKNERLTLAAAASEKVITHARVREMTGLHPFDATRLLQNLVRDGFLEPHNPGRGAVYCLPGAAIPKPEEVFGASIEQSNGSSAHLLLSSAHLPVNQNVAAEQRDADGCLLSDQLDAPVIDALERLEPVFFARLEIVAAEPRAKAKIPKVIMRQTILTVCKGHYVTLNSLARLLNRDADALRQQHLKPLDKEGKLRLAFPTAPTHAKQAYRAVE
ncbi:MAG: AAA family ATPase [Verrucomicrobia bacterium]|nr:AAA family ATPase [Verrucomicrobiota bacterium]